jgi:hypothetical protein
MLDPRIIAVATTTSLLGVVVGAAVERWLSRPSR